MLMNKTMKDLNKWKDILCLLVERPNKIKMPIISKLIYRFNAVPIKIKAKLFVNVGNIILYCSTRIDKIFKKIKIVQRLALHDIKS